MDSLNIPCASHLGFQLGIGLPSLGFLLLQGNTRTKASWGGKEFFDLHFHIGVLHRRQSGQEFKQARGLEAGADTGAMKEYCLLLAHHGLLRLLSYRPQDRQPREGTTHNVLGPPPQSLTEKMFYRLACTARPNEGVFSTEAISSLMTLAYAKLT